MGEGQAWNNGKIKLFLMEVILASGLKNKWDGREK